MRETVLVTGGAGFIGSHVVDACIGRGYRVVVLDNFSTGDRRNVHPRAEVVEGDLRNGALVDALFESGVDRVSHHAAQIDVRHSVADPAFDAEVNVVGSLRLIEAARRAGVKRFVFASTGGAIYGEARSAPQSESDPTRPLSPYGCAKLAVEHYLHCYREVHGLSSVALRYANVYGPRQNSLGEAGVVAIFAAKLLAGQPLQVNGSGEQTRDYVFVDDVVRANVAALEGTFEGSFNVGTGVETSVLEVAAALQRVSGRAAAVVHAEAKKGEQMRSVLDGTALRSLAHLPAPVAFEEGLSATFQWFAGR